MPVETTAEQWAREAGVGACSSTRAGGVSAAPWHSLNLGSAVGDDPGAVRENRERFAKAIGARPIYLRQVHGARAVRLTVADADAAERAEPLEADASITDEVGLACTVLVADCLAVLLAAPQGRAVAAAHAGWRGLGRGVLDATVAALCERAACAPAALRAWSGPCIGPRHFEVGADVLEAFGRPAEPADGPRFAWSPRADGTPRWRADLPGLAHDRLRALGLLHITASGACTVEDASRFFSFRRDGVTGRFAAAVWRLG